MGGHGREEECMENIYFRTFLNKELDSHLEDFFSG